MFGFVRGVLLLDIFILVSGIWVVTPGWLLASGPIVVVVVVGFLIWQKFSGCFWFCSGDWFWGYLKIIGVIDVVQDLKDFWF